MKYWSRYPVFRFLIPFSTGIITGIHCNFSVTTVLTVGIITFFLSYWFTYKNLATGKYAHRWLAGIPFYCCFLMMGFTLTTFFQSRNFSAHFTDFSNPCLAIFEIKEPPVQTLKGYRIIGIVKAVKNDKVWESTRGNLMIFIADTLSYFNAAPGDELVIQTQYKTIPPPSNPGAFDYRKFMSGKGVWHQGFVSGKQYSILERNRQTSIFTLAAGLRESLLHKLKNHIPDENERGVAGALLLGYDDWLDPELENHYAATGVLHILCVSGMHVGLIYMIFSWLLVWLEKKPLFRHIRFATLICLIWFYAIVTGLAPSVIRASTMLTFVIAGKWMNKNTNIYNTLCGSCMFMFTVNPYLIMSAGFLLSFLAVCGIVFLQRSILTLWNAPGTLLHKTWELISVSISAQLTTSPLSIFLFNQFPNYFILGNLFVIPLTPVVMYSGLSLFATDWIPYAGFISGTVTSFTIYLINSMVVFFGSIPGAVTTGIYLSFSEMILMYIIIIVGVGWLNNKSHHWLYATMITIILFLGIRTHTLFYTHSQQIITVYDSSYNTLISIINGPKAMVITDSVIDEKVLKYSLKGHLLQSMIQEEIMIEVSDNIILWLGAHEVAHIKNLNKNFTMDTMLVKTLILGGNVRAKPDEIISHFNPQTVVFDASCRRWQVEKLEKYFEGAGIKTHCVKNAGAYQLNASTNPLAQLKQKFLSSVPLFR